MESCAQIPLAGFPEDTTTVDTANCAAGTTVIATNTTGTNVIYSCLRFFDSPPGKPTRYYYRLVRRTRTMLVVEKRAGNGVKVARTPDGQNTQR